MKLDTKKTVIANTTTFGRDKEMDVVEYTRRAVTDHRCMAYDNATRDEAQRMYDMQVAFAAKCFEELYRRQNA